MLNSPQFLLRFGIVLMLVGVALPFLMVIQVLESTFSLNFFAWGTSVTGLGLGMIGFVRNSKGKRD